MLDIVIPTYGRAARQQTLSQLIKAGLTTTLVVQAREVSAYDRWTSHPLVKVHVLPQHIQTIAPTRQYILENVGTQDEFCMVDDDLVFFKRRSDEPGRLRDASPQELAEAFKAMRDILALPDVAHAGFASREGANRNTDEFVLNTRIMRVLGYKRSTLKSCGARFDEMEVMEDFHVALQLLEKGYRNVLLNDYAHNQSGSGSEGGCSHFRTPELHAANAEKLRRLHPDFVKVVSKTTKTAWGGGTRKDVNIQWKKAYGSAR